MTDAAQIHASLVGSDLLPVSGNVERHLRPAVGLDEAPGRPPRQLLRTDLPRERETVAARVVSQFQRDHPLPAAADTEGDVGPRQCEERHERFVDHFQAGRLGVDIVAAREGLAGHHREPPLARANPADPNALRPAALAVQDGEVVHPPLQTNLRPVLPHLRRPRRPLGRQDQRPVDQKVRRAARVDRQLICAVDRGGHQAGVEREIMIGAAQAERILCVPNSIGLGLVDHLLRGQESPGRPRRRLARARIGHANRRDRDGERAPLPVDPPPLRLWVPVVDVIDGRTRRGPEQHRRLVVPASREDPRREHVAGRVGHHDLIAQPLRPALDVDDRPAGERAFPDEQ